MPLHNALGRVRIMRVTRVEFGAFKSLYEVSCSFERFTVITGPNGSGKSNFVDALNFVGEAYNHGLEMAVSRAGGFENIAHRRTRRAKRPVRVSLELAIDEVDLKRLVNQRYLVELEEEGLAEALDELPLQYRHTFALATDTQGISADFRLVDEVLEIATSRGVYLTVSRNDDGGTDIRMQTKNRTASLVKLLRPFDNTNFRVFLKEATPRNDLLVAVGMHSPLIASIRNAVSRFRVFQLSPHQCRTTGVATPNATLERHGDNLPGAADHLIRKDQRSWAAVEQAMRAIVPGLESIGVTHTEDRRLALQFREKGVGRPWSVNEVSDGTVQSLAVFVAMFDRRNLMMVIEEPENSIHPWILRKIVDLLRSDAADKQVIMTTHSPVLLDYVDPTTIRLMSLRGGRSSIKEFLSYDEDIRRSVIAGDLTVFQAYDSGVILEGIPQGMGSDL